MRRWHQSYSTFYNFFYQKADKKEQIDFFDRFIRLFFNKYAKLVPLLSWACMFSFWFWYSKQVNNFYRRKKLLDCYFDWKPILFKIDRVSNITFILNEINKFYFKMFCSLCLITNIIWPKVNKLRNQINVHKNTYRNVNVALWHFFLFEA